MNKIIFTEEQHKKFIDLKEALKTDCQTPNVIYNIKINDKNISIELELPEELDINGDEAKILEANIHNSLEIILSKYFK